MKSIYLLPLILVVGTAWAQEAMSLGDIIADGTEVRQLAGDFIFTEGPANDASGDIYFTDIRAEHIIKWSFADQSATVFIENSGGSNGLWFNQTGQLFVCQGLAKQVSEIDLATKTFKPLATHFAGKPFNKPNDLWMDSKGGIYFSDPNYGKQEATQERESVYYRRPDGEIIEVIADMKRPNGVLGTPDGTMLYATDASGNQTFSYTINEDGTLANKTLIAETGSDGMTLDEHGNLYLTKKAVKIYAPDHTHIGDIPVPEAAANVCFGGPDGTTLVITARKGLYAIDTKVRGIYAH